MKHMPEMLFILCIRLVAHSFSGIEIPILAGGCVPAGNPDKGGWWHGRDPREGRAMSGRKKGEPSGDILLIERNGLSIAENQGIEEVAPGDLTLIESIVKLAGA